MTAGLDHDAIRSQLHALASDLQIDEDRGWADILGRFERLGNKTARPSPRAAMPQRIRKSRRLTWAASVAGGAGLIGYLTLSAGPAGAMPAVPQPLPFTHGSHQSAVAILDTGSAIQRLKTSASDKSKKVRYAETQHYALQADIGRRASKTTFETSIRQVWVSPDGSGVEHGWVQDTKPNGTDVGSMRSPTTDSNWRDDTPSLPTATTDLAAVLLGSGAVSNDRDVALAQSIMLRLGEGTATPQQISSLYALLASEPGAFDAGPITDNAGRNGRAVGIVTGTFDAGRSCLRVTSNTVDATAQIAQHSIVGTGITYLILDTVTGQPLQIEEVDSPNPPCGLRLPSGSTVEQYNIILDSGGVTQTGQASK